MNRPAVFFSQLQHPAGKGKHGMGTVPTKSCRIKQGQGLPAKPGHVFRGKIKTGIDRHGFAQFETVCSTIALIWQKLSSSLRFASRLQSTEKNRWAGGGSPCLAATLGWET